MHIYQYIIKSFLFTLSAIRNRSPPSYLRVRRCTSGPFRVARRDRVGRFRGWYENKNIVKDPYQLTTIILRFILLYITCLIVILLFDPHGNLLTKGAKFTAFVCSLHVHAIYLIKTESKIKASKTLLKNSRSTNLYRYEIGTLSI